MKFLCLLRDNASDQLSRATMTEPGWSEIGVGRTSMREINKAAENYYFTSQQTGIDNRCRERMIRRC
jgi:hypothetical protein